MNDMDDECRAWLTDPSFTSQFGQDVFLYYNLFNGSGKPGKIQIDANDL